MFMNSLSLINKHFEIAPKSLAEDPCENTAI